ncbi:LacI family DNA-binding transcriptional regulator [Kitasatospora sp. NA04385]|uniref:LacI family DNA-binding transcriptional regulator n=1 Tax=Kitasatospora sp. NA04385 TaxID=2742135 RepID=UPI00158FE42D|nr:LacI family DNA-binding transcriptional regulator [Kitasatospora sp. NA04385]QKW17713.1 LacI family DNA-binding transcriptional regulator [Kitasatospora sp. NA04385]
MAVTLGDVARHAGVSLATASRALNGSARSVTEELSTRVRASARALGYLPNAPAQALARSTGTTVGVLLHDVADPYFGGIARGVGDAAARAGLLTLVTSTDGDPRRELEAIRMLHAHRARAIVLAGSAYGDVDVVQRLDEALAAYQAQGGRVVAISDHGPLYDTVHVHNREGAASLAHSLVQLGHRRFAVITGPQRMRVAGDRLDGVLEALHETGLELPEGMLQRAEFTREGGRAAMARILEAAGGNGAPRPTAVLALSDICAAGALAELRARGVSVPGEVSVAGFDDIPLATDLAPALSTVRLPLTAMGESAVRLALRESGPEAQQAEAFAEVVLRDSTAAPATG